MARIVAVWTKEMARALKYAVEPFITEQLSSKQGHYMSPLLGCSKFFFANINALCKNKLVYSVSRILCGIHFTYGFSFVPSRKARKWLLV